MVDQHIQRATKPTPEPLIISELQLKTTVYGWLFATEVLLRRSTSGKPFLDIRLRDQRGNEILGRYFDPPTSEGLLPQEGKVVLIDGTVEKYLNQTQIRLIHARTDESAPSDLFVLGTRRPLVQLENHFQQLLDRVYHSGLHQLLRRCFVPEVMGRFRRWPAAVSHHGTVTGGLLEHTVNVTLIADRMTQLYPCNQDLVLAGALLHDIGKLEELKEQVGLGFTPDGYMFGHIVRGMQYVQEQAQKLPELDATTGSHLLHIILAHHTKEFGSPISPVTIEALIVHLADKAEANLTGFLEHCERTAGSDGWSSFSVKYGSQLRVP